MLPVALTSCWDPCSKVFGCLASVKGLQHKGLCQPPLPGDCARPAGHQKWSIWTKQQLQETCFCVAVPTASSSLPDSFLSPQACTRLALNCSGPAGTRKQASLLLPHLNSGKRHLSCWGHRLAIPSRTQCWTAPGKALGMCWVHQDLMWRPLLLTPWRPYCPCCHHPHHLGSHQLLLHSHRLLLHSWPEDLLAPRTNVPHWDMSPHGQGW